MSWPADNRDSDDFEVVDAYDHYDESSVRSRPNPKANRPRTKTRPKHESAIPGFVLSIDRGRYDVLLDEGLPTERQVRATAARELARKSVVTGDRVQVVGDTSGDDGSLARIVRVDDRSTVLRRSADDTDDVERVIVANADQLMIVTAAANPEPRVRLIDRYVLAAIDAGITPLLCVTKTDLADPTEFLSHFAGLDIPVILSRSDQPPLQQITQRLLGHRTVFVGHSGVGKSTLVNALVPGANRATGDVNQVTGRGRHTSSSSLTLKVERGSLESAIGTLPDHGWVIDTPGVRSFGLGHVNPDRLLEAFPDLIAISDECPRGCTHASDAPDCAITEAVDREVAHEPTSPTSDRLRVRLDSLHRLVATFTARSDSN